MRLKDRHGRRLRLILRGLNGAAAELGASELEAVLRVRRDMPRLSGRPAFAAGTGLSQSLCDWVLEKILGVAPVRAELELQDAGTILFDLPADRGNFLNDIHGIVIEDQYDASGVRGKTVVDAGANIGIFTLYALALGAKKLYAFEPVKETFKMLKGNIALNRAGRLVRAENIALGAADCEAVLKFNTEGDGSSMLAGAGGEVNPGVNYSGVRIVKLAPLDSLVKSRVDFLKMDVEGYEEEVLLGARGIIKKHKPVLSFAAYHRKTDRERLPQVVRSIRNDYKIALNSFAEHDIYCQ